MRLNSTDHKSMILEKKLKKEKPNILMLRVKTGNFNAKYRLLSQQFGN